MSQNKKLSLRERMALKKKKGGNFEEFHIPTPAPQYGGAQQQFGGMNQMGMFGNNQGGFNQMGMFGNQGGYGGYNAQNQQQQQQMYYNMMMNQQQQQPNNMFGNMQNQGQAQVNNFQQPNLQEAYQQEAPQQPVQEYKTTLQKTTPHTRGNNSHHNQKNTKGNKNKGNNNKTGKDKKKKGGKGKTGNKKMKPKQKFKKEEILDKEEIVQKNAARVFDQTKESMNIIIIGHVDSGKSTICGNMLVKSGKVDGDELRKFEQEAKEKGRESWIWAYVMDINEEEREKGKTVEVGKASFDLEHKRYIILDCPGHKNYVPNMIAGAAQADVAALVVSAKAGEFEAGFEKAGQTREHAILASNMGSSSLIVIVNKMDECEWKKDRFDYIQKNLIPFLEETCGYDVKTQVVWVPVDGFHGVNINTPVGKELCPWYDGKTLFDTMDVLPKADRIKRDCLRIPVFDAFKDQGNLAIFGKVESGMIKEGMKLTLMPQKKPLKVLKIFDNEDREVAFAESGDNIKIFIKGIEIVDIKKGHMICGQQYYPKVCQVFEAEITVIDPPDKKIVSNGFGAVLHLHTIQAEVIIKKVKSNITLGRKKGLLTLKPNETGIVTIYSETPLCVEKFSEFPEIARFSLRAEANTVAVGKVLRIKPMEKYNINTDYYAYKEKMKLEAAKKEGEPTK